MLYLVNAFSLNMLPDDFDGGSVSITRMTTAGAALLAYANRGAGLTNAIGHPDTDRVVRGMLAEVVGKSPDDLPAPPEGRPTVTLGPGDALIVAQYRGPRLPAGATKLPEGARIDFYLIEMEQRCACRLVYHV